MDASPAPSADPAAAARPQPPERPAAPAGGGHAAAVHYVGEPVVFEGYADDFEHNIAAVQFSLDDGASWTAYPTQGARSDRGVRWTFSYTPQRAGRYLLKARAVDGRGAPSSLISSYAFEVLDVAANVYGGFGLRAVGGGSLRSAMVYRSGELSRITAEEATFLVNALGLRAVYDIRNQWEVAARPEPCLVGIKMVAVEPSTERRRTDAKRRLAPGVIGEYGAPGERMCANYRRYVREYPLVGMVLRSMAAEGRPALVHCKNGKDRTGVLCAALLRIAGASDEAVMADYLATNRVNAEQIARDMERMGAGMTADERAVLASFLEARPAYLQAFFDEIDAVYGSFARYVSNGLRLTPEQCDRLRCLVGQV